MAKRAGRNLLLKRGTDVIGGVRMLSIKFDATPIDVTDADSDGLVTYLAGEAATKQVSIEVSGILDTNFLRVDAINPTTDLLMTNLTFTDPGAPIAGDVISGNFFMTNFTSTGSYDAAVEFSATFTSSGAWTAA